MRILANGHSGVREGLGNTASAVRQAAAKTGIPKRVSPHTRNQPQLERILSLDVVDRRTQLIVGESRRSGKRVSDFRVVAQNSHARRVEQALSKEVRCRILESRRRRKSGALVCRL